VPVRGDFVATIGTIDTTGMALEIKTKIGIETGIAMTTEIEVIHGETVKIFDKIESESKLFYETQRPETTIGLES
jgi:hypothetical protein